MERDRHAGIQRNVLAEYHRISLYRTLERCCCGQILCKIFLPFYNFSAKELAVGNISLARYISICHKSIGRNVADKRHLPIRNVRDGEDFAVDKRKALHSASLLNADYGHLVKDEFSLSVIVRVRFSITAN